MEESIIKQILIDHQDAAATHPDPDILQYIISVVNDDTFEFGDDAADAFEAIGPLLVRIV